mgnify:CR=1 FL=1
MLFSSESKLTQFINKIVDLLFLSILWTICTATILGSGIAGIALYYAVAKSVRKERDHAVRSFFKAVKDNWKTGLLVGLLLTVFAASVYFVDVSAILRLLAGKEKLLGILSCVKVFLIAGITLYALPILSRFQVGVIQAVGMAFVLAFRHLGTTLYLGVLLIVSAVLVIWQPVLLMILPGIFALLWSKPMDKILLLYMSEKDKTPDGETDQWYAE